MANERIVTLYAKDLWSKWGFEDGDIFSHIDTDGKWRPVEPGTRALAHGLPAGLVTAGTGLRQLATLAGTDNRDLKSAKKWRVGTLRGYGNAINVHVAAEFLRAVLE